MLKHIVKISVYFVYISSLAQQGFNEIYDSNGNVRAEYEYAQSQWQQHYAKNQNQFLDQSRKAFKGDNALDSMPRILTSEDYDILKKGVEQRALAIRAFLTDHYSGRKEYAQSNVIPKEVVKRIIARSGEAGYKGLIAPKNISFFYGPDIIKDSEGNWRVIEDNMGFIGGIGDMLLAQKFMLKAYPEMEETIEPRSAQDFYEDVARSFHERARLYKGKPILYVIRDYSADNEDKRISKIFDKLGIETITPKSEKKLAITKEGVYLVSKTKNGKKIKEKVGFIFLNGEHAWTDPSHPAALQRLVIEEASSLLKEKDTKEKNKKEITKLFNSADSKTLIPNISKMKKYLDKIEPVVDDEIEKKNRGLLNAILQDQVGVNYSPGVDFIGDKEFYVYIEDLVQFYLNQEPLLKNIETRKFVLEGTNQVDTTMIRRIFSSLYDYVIKKVDGRGGDSVWVGPKIKPNEIPFLIKSIKANPQLYIVQRYTPLSYLNKNIVDLRVITDVSEKEIIVTNTPWGRGLPMNGNGKVNLSDKGREVTVLVANKNLQKKSFCLKFY